MSPSPVEERAARLRDGLRREHDVYRDLMDLTERQQEILAAGRTDEILQLARSKERVLARIDAIEEELTPLKEEWPDLRDQVENQVRGEIESERTRLKGVLEGLIRLEEEGQRSMQEMRQQTTDELRRVDGGRRVQQAYAGSPSRPRYLDRSH